MAKSTESVRKLLNNSLSLALDANDTEIRVEHMFKALLSYDKDYAIHTLEKMGVNIPNVEELLNVYIDQRSVVLEKTKEKSPYKSVLPFNPVAKAVVTGMDEESKLLKNETINTLHFLLSLLKNSSTFITKILQKDGINYKSLLQKINNMGVLDDLNNDEGSDFKKKYQSGRTRTPVLDNFGKDITELARDGKIDPVIGREGEIERVSQILSRRKKNNPVLIGEPGVGKSTIIEGLALKIVTKKCPRILHDKRIVSLDLASIVAGTKYRGQFEERLKGIMEELEKVDNVILFIDELHTLVGAGNSSGSLDASNILKPALARGEIQVVGATTLDEYREKIEKDGALTRRFQQVLVEPPTKEETLNILNNIKDKYEDYHKVEYTEEAVEECVRLADRYITDREFPDKAIDILDEAGARSHVHIEPPKEISKLEGKIDKVKLDKERIVKEQKYEEAASLRDKERKLTSELEYKRKKWEISLDEERIQVTDDKVSEVVAMMTGIPLSRISANEMKRIANMDEALKGSVIGQNEAVEKVCQAIKRNRLGIKDPNKPIGSFVLLGATGVGKTELAKTLAKYLFESEDALIRVDMSEYMEKFSASKLIGAPPGYVGYEEGGQLTEKVRRKPYSVVLFDEIEKAHPDIFNSLLQILDEGFITDGLGRKINFKNTLILMTSNIGIRDIDNFGGGLGFSNDDDPHAEDERHKSIINKALKKAMAPEFINRLDDIIIFNNLTKDNIGDILEIKLKGLKERLTELGYTIKLGKTLKEFLVEKGYDIKFGARPLQRAIQKYIENPISEEMLKGEIKEGDTLALSYNKKSGKVKVSVKK